MGAPQLSTYVHVVEMVTNDKGQQEPGRAGAFGPGDELPDWAVAAISNPDVWDGDPPPRPKQPASQPSESRADELARLEARIAELKAASGTGGDDKQPARVPPRKGPGSGAPAWREYATAKGVDVGEDASRDDIIAALDEAGVPTE